MVAPNGNVGWVALPGSEYSSSTITRRANRDKLPRFAAYCSWVTPLRLYLVTETFPMQLHLSAPFLFISALSHLISISAVLLSALARCCSLSLISYLV